jgi:FKBP-type peptidyl-prolyl cis-trans isomerase FklB
MNDTMKYAALLALCVILSSCESPKREETSLRTHKDSLSYAIGLDIGRNLRRQAIEIDPAILAHGMKDMYDSTGILMTDSVNRYVTAEFRTRARARHTEEVRVEAEKNTREGEGFLAENRKKEGVVELPSGLQYKVVKMGTGRKPKLGQTVTVKFRGTLLDGTEFDNSDKNPEPSTYSVDAVIKGWMEALQLMPAGSKWLLYLPPSLAFGERGAGQTIPPAATVIFELELLQVK